jgi:hypothetical protein
MKRRLLIALRLLVLFIAARWAMGQSGWHLNRNKHNALPSGQLVLKKDLGYQDACGRDWGRLPAHMNAFHQP